MKKESARDAERIKERAVFLWVALQIDSVRVQPVFADKQDTGNTGTRPKVADADAAGDMHIAKQLFAEFEGIGAHEFKAHECCVEAAGLWEGCHACVSIDLMLRTN